MAAAEEKIEDPSDDTHNKAIIIGLYVLFVLSVIGQIAPAMSIQIGSALMVLVILAVAGHYRKKNASGLLHDHAVYFIRTIWVWSFILMICFGVAGFYASTTYSYDEFLSIAQTLAAGHTDDPQARQFGLLGLASTIPSLIYLSYRLGRGLWYILRDTPLPNPKAFF